MSEPQWLANARSYIGFHEQPGNHGIQQFVSMAHCGADGESWCSIFANAMLESSGFPGTRSAMARSFESNPNFVRLDTPRLGCIVTYWRGSPSSGEGHVDFWTGTDAQGRILGLGGNQQDAVNIAPQNPEHVTGFWWPAAQQAQPQSSDFAAALPLLLASEGGNDDDPRDPGGRTSRGILQREWDKWRASHPDLPTDVWQAPDSEVRAIYRANYWNALQCDSLPAGVDYCVFDYGVNSGISRAAKVLQSLVGADQDGEVGPLTMAATAKADARALVDRICDQRLAFLQSLPTWPTFGNGWTSRVSRVRTDSTAMAAKGKPMTDTATQTAPQQPFQQPTIPSSPFHFDLQALVSYITEHPAEAQQMIGFQAAAFHALFPALPLALPGLTVPPVASIAAPVAPVGTPALQRPSVQASIGALALTILGQITHQVGAPVAVPGLIPADAVTHIGTLSTVLPMLSTVFGATGGWASIAKLAAKVFAFIPK